MLVLPSVSTLSRPGSSVLQQMQAQRDFKLLQYLAPERRVFSAVARNNAWLVEELAIVGTPCDVKDVRVLIKRLPSSRACGGRSTGPAYLRRHGKIISDLSQAIRAH
jgi:hypothetical protein